MQFRRLPSNMKVRLSDYMECKYNRKLFDEEKILNELNPLLVQKLWENKGKKLLDTVDFLKECEQEFKSILLTKLKLEIYLQGDTVVQAGEPATCMYFIRQGTITIKYEDSDVEFQSKDGNNFGEVSLICDEVQVRKASVNADSNLQLFSLSRKDFHELLEEYPRSQESIKSWRKFAKEMEEERKKAQTIRENGGKYSRAASTFYDMQFDIRGSRCPGQSFS